jgi:hypothetical protein
LWQLWLAYFSSSGSVLFFYSMGCFVSAFLASVLVDPIVLSHVNAGFDSVRTPLSERVLDSVCLFLSMILLLGVQRQREVFHRKR